MADQNQREQWIEAARQAVENGDVTVVCPANGDAVLRAEWVPLSANNGKEGGEFRLWCPVCGATNYVLKRH